MLGYKKKQQEKPGFLGKMTPKQFKLFVWGGMGFCILFIVVATVILVNMYTVFTRDTRIDLYTELLTVNELIQLNNDIQRKYHFVAGDPLPAHMSDVDRFNFQLTQFLIAEDFNRIMAMNSSDNFRRVDGLHRTEPGAAVNIFLSDDFYVPVYYEPGEDGFVITIDGTVFEKTGTGGADTIFYTAPYGPGHNRLILVAIGQGHLSTQTFAFYHDGENVHFAGELPVGVMDILITDRGSISLRNQQSVFFGWPVNIVMAMDEEHRLARTPPPSRGFDLSVPQRLFTRGEIIVFQEPDVNSQTDVVPEAFVIEIVGSNERNFLQGRVGTSYFFIWFPEPGIIDNGGIRVPARDLLFGLPLN